MLHDHGALADPRGRDEDSALKTPVLSETPGPRIAEYRRSGDVPPRFCLIGDAAQPKSNVGCRTIIAVPGPGHRSKPGSHGMQSWLFPTRLPK